MAITLIAICVSTLAVILAWKYRSRWEEAQNSLEARFAEVKRAGRIGTWERQTGQHGVKWSKEVYEIHGVTGKADLVAFDDWMSLFHPADRPSCVDAMERAGKNRASFEIDARILKPNGFSGWVRFSGRFRSDEGADRLQGTIMNISHHRAAEEMIQEYRAVFGTRLLAPGSGDRDTTGSSLADGALGITNHLVFVDQLDHELKRARRYKIPLTVLLVDADMNDQYRESIGHQAAQHLLRQIAAVLQLNARETDIVARYGGDGFAVILPMTDGEGARIAATRIQSAIKNSPWPLRSVTVRFGITEAREDLAANDLIALCLDDLGKPMPTA